MSKPRPKPKPCNRVEIHICIHVPAKTKRIVVNRPG
jgi:hypothetical protein